MKPEQIAALRAAAEKATPGPWELTVHTGNHKLPESFDPYNADDWTLRSENGQSVAFEEGIYEGEDVRFIAAANPATILALLDHIAKLEAGRDAVLEEAALQADASIGIYATTTAQTIAKRIRALKSSPEVPAE